MHHERGKRCALISLCILALAVLTDRSAGLILTLTDSGPRCGAGLFPPPPPRHGIVDVPRVEDIDPIRKAEFGRQLAAHMPPIKFEKAEGKKADTRKTARNSPIL